MRQIKLPAAIAAGATLLALAPAGALARPAGHKHPHALGIGACHISINVEPRPSTAGEPVSVFGVLTCGGAPAASQTVTILQRTVGTPAFTSAGTATTEEKGGYQLTTGALEHNTVFYASAAGASSARKTAAVAPQVSMTTPIDGAQLTIGHPRPLASLSNTVTFRGKVSPALSGARISLQRENESANEEWHRIGLGQVLGANGEYAITHTFTAPGDANVRVVVHPGKRNIAAASSPVSLEISQAQNPRLTINSSANPIVDGQSATITGTDAAGANQLVTLLARTNRTKIAIAIASAKTNEKGEYTFNESPTNSTIYHVTAAGVNSRLLFEGVKFALAPNPLPSAALIGQELTFSGTVSPSPPGQVVYLERRDLSGVAFHIIDVAQVTNGSYSISYAFFKPGPAMVRIKVPGDGYNQGVASPLLTLGLAPAPASTLIPQPPVKQSPIGQL